MTSSVLDGMLCLLLISGAVVAVTTATPDSGVDGGRAPAVASTLATSTATVNYTLAPGARRAEGADVAVPTTDDPAFERTAHGTLAGLLARAATANVAVDGRPLSHAGDDLQQQVGRAVAGAVRANHTRITAVWRPYPNASLSGRVVVGGRPPPDVPVHAATLNVSSGYPARRDAVLAATDRGFEGVAAVVAAGVVTGSFPPTRTRISAGSDYPTSALVRYRYRRAAALFGANVSTDLDSGGVGAANARLADALASRIERDLRATTDSPREAARGVRLGRVRITVRTWS